MATYVVKPGDSAASLYDRSYGDYQAWVRNVGRLTPGQTINLPDVPLVGQAPRVGQQTVQPAPSVYGPAPAVPALGSVSPAIGQAFPRDQAVLTSQGAIYTALAAMRTPQALPAVITPQGTAPNIGGFFAPPPLETAPTGALYSADEATVARSEGRRFTSTGQGLLTPAQQALMAASGGYAAAGRGTNRAPDTLESTRVIGGVTYKLSIDSAGNRLWRAQGTRPPNFKNQLEYLDTLRATDPERAAEVARFQAATIGRSSSEAALATNVFFTEKAIFEQGILARNASENVWDVIAQRLGTGQTGAELLKQRGYVPIGGGLWYLGRLGGGSGTDLGAASERNLARGGGGGGGGGGRFQGNERQGLIMWRIG